MLARARVRTGKRVREIDEQEDNLQKDSKNNVAVDKWSSFKLQETYPVGDINLFPHTLYSTVDRGEALITNLT